MCLSTVYAASDTERSQPLAKNVTSVSVAGDEVCLRTLLGEQSVIKGTLAQIDLVKNFIIIAPAAA